MNITLRIPDEHDKYEYLDFYNECTKSVKNLHINGTHTLVNLDYSQWLSTVKQYIIDPPKGRVKCTQFIAANGEGRIIGTIQLRHELTDHLRIEGGHIGYTVRPSERRKGYATRMLLLCLKEAKKLRINRILITCSNDNLASEKTILHNGGVYKKLVTLENGTIKKHYWIDLSPKG